MSLRVFVLALLAAGCAPTSPPPSSVAGSDTLRWGSSFGMCLGYCMAELRVTPDGEATLTETAPRTDEPPRVRSLTLTPDEHATLRDALDARAFADADTLYGCPDCADGGAEFVAVGERRVVYEYGRPPGPVARLAEALRTVRDRLAPPD